MWWWFRWLLLLMLLFYRFLFFVLLIPFSIFPDSFWWFVDWYSPILGACLRCAALVLLKFIGVKSKKKNNERFKPKKKKRTQYTCIEWFFFSFFFLFISFIKYIQVKKLMRRDFYLHHNLADERNIFFLFLSWYLLFRLLDPVYYSVFGIQYSVVRVLCALLFLVCRFHVVVVVRSTDCRMACAT